METIKNNSPQKCEHRFLVSQLYTNLQGLSLFNICFLSDSTQLFSRKLQYKLPVDSLATHETKVVLLLSNQSTKQKWFGYHMLQTRRCYICT